MTQPLVHPASRDGEPLTPRARLEGLCDRGTLQVVGSARRTPAYEDAPDGDGVLCATGLVAGRPVACFAHDGSFRGGSLGEVPADAIVRLLSLAKRAEIPVVGFFECAGARVQEGVSALGAFGRVFRAIIGLSRRVPQITVLTGASAGGGAYAPALTDFVIMTPSARAFLTGPKVVRDVLGEEVDPVSLGGPDVHARNGVCQFEAKSEVEAIVQVRTLLAYLPQSVSEPPPVLPSRPPNPSADPAEVLPDDPRKAYDIRDVVRRIVDGDSLLEIAPRWAPNVVTALARLDGRVIGVVANQPRRLGGALDVRGSRKAARFVRQCDAFGIPFAVLVDTPGFMPGQRQEAEGLIGYGAGLVTAMVEAEVLRMTVVVRKAFGGGYIAMNSRDLGADLSVAWPSATMGVLGASQGVSICHQRELSAAAPEDREAVFAALVARYEREQLSAAAAARTGQIDEVIAPADTRDRLIRGLALLHRRGERRRTFRPETEGASAEDVALRMWEPAEVDPDPDQAPAHVG